MYFTIFYVNVLKEKQTFFYFKTHHNNILISLMDSEQSYFNPQLNKN